MSRTQDLVLARLRLIAMRWQGGLSATTESPGRVDGADAGPPDAPASDSGWPVPGTGVRLVGLLVVIVAIGVVGLLITSGPRVQQPEAGGAPVATESGDPFADPFSATSPSPSPPVMVHVAGDVRDPGVVRLPAGSRVVDAVRAAGGLRRGGELGATNLARVLADGERIEVGGQQAGVAGEAGGGTGSVGGLLDLNAATAEQLDALPGIGPVTAAKILGWRSTHKRFSVVDELAEVPGIGPKTLADLRPLVRV